MGDSSLDETTPRAAVAGPQQQMKENDQHKVEGSPEKACVDQPETPARKSRKGNVTSRQPSRQASRQKSTQVPRLSMSSANIPVDIDTPSPGCILPRSKTAKTADGPYWPRQPIPKVAPRNIKRPTGATTANMQNLAHGASDQILKSENCDERLAAYAGHRSSSRSSNISKRSGRWSWSGWFS